MKLIGQFRNEWRKRDVFIYQDDHDREIVITVGIPFEFVTLKLKPIVCEELRSAYTAYIFTQFGGHGRTKYE